MMENKKDYYIIEERDYEKYGSAPKVTYIPRPPDPPVKAWKGKPAPVVSRAAVISALPETERRKAMKAEAEYKEIERQITLATLAYYQPQTTTSSLMQAGVFFKTINGVEYIKLHFYMTKIYLQKEAITYYIYKYNATGKSGIKYIRIEIDTSAAQYVLMTNIEVFDTDGELIWKVPYSEMKWIPIEGYDVWVSVESINKLLKMSFAELLKYAEEKRDSRAYNKLTEEQRLFIATIAGESIGQGSIAWTAVGHVIMNRVADTKREWRNLNTVTDVIAQPWAFTCYTREEPEYVKALNYLINRTGDNKLYEELIQTVMPIYNKKTYDITGGAQLYYSPRSMVPAGSEPSWASSDELVELFVEDIDSWYFRFYKYK